MYILKIAFFVLIAAIALEVSCKKDGKGKIKKSLQSLSTCVGKPLDLSSQLSSVDECLNARVAEAEEQTKSGTKKKSKKNGKKDEKLKKLKKKCLAECEWTALGLDISTETAPTDSSNETSNTTNFDTILTSFPTEAHEGLRTKLKLCLDSSEIESGKSGKDSCSGSKKLMKCLRKAVKQVCSGDGTGQNSTSENAATTTTSTMAPNGTNLNNQTDSTMTPSNGTNRTNQTRSTTVKPNRNNNDDDEDDEDDSDDDDNEDYDDDESDKETTTTIPEAPSTMVNTSERITR